MSKVLILYEREIPTVSITRGSFAFYDSKGVTESKFCPVSDVRAEDINAADILYFIRPNDITSLSIAKQAKDSGRLIIVFFDDDLLGLSADTPFAFWRKKYMIQMMECADVLLSSSRYLAEKYAKRFSINRIGLTETVVKNEEFSKVKKDEHTEIRLVYAAGPKHVAFFNRFILPILPRLIERYGEQLSLTCVGLYPDLDIYKDKMDIQIVSSKPLLQYRKYMQEQQFDIGLAPLITNEFTKCKYYNKFLEYTTANVVGVYSNTEPYTFAVKDGINGFLANDSEESWYEKLCKAIDNSELRERCLDNAIAQVKEIHNADEILSRFIATVPELKTGMDNKQTIERVNRKKFCYIIMRVLDYFYLTLFYLRHAGLKGVIEKIKIHFKERANFVK